MINRNNDIKLLVMDVDGTLTSGKIEYGSNDIEIKAFNVRDGLAIKACSDIGIQPVIITGRKSEAVERRSAELGCELYQGIDDKLSTLRKVCSAHSVVLDEVLYIGDDLNDYECMSACGFRSCPADAADEIINICDYVSPLKGGESMVRDAIEYFLKKSGQWQSILEIYRISL